MIWQLDVIMLILLVISAIGSLWIKDLLASAGILGAYSFMICLIWVSMGAIDVAFTEAAVGAGISTVLMVATVFTTTRESKD